MSGSRTTSPERTQNRAPAIAQSLSGPDIAWSQRSLMGHFNVVPLPPVPQPPPVHEPPPQLLQPPQPQRVMRLNVQMSTEVPENNVEAPPNNH